MAKTFVAIIKGPESLIKGGMLIEKLELTDEEIQDFLDGGDDETEEDAIVYYCEEYVAEWEQRFCIVTLLTPEQYDHLYDGMGVVIKEELAEEEDDDDRDPDNYRSFVLSKAQVDKYNAWRKEKGEVYVGAIGGAYKFCFTPTGLGDFVTVECADGTSLDLTDYDLL
jgi:hypothetical protein